MNLMTEMACSKRYRKQLMPFSYFANSDEKWCALSFSQVMGVNGTSKSMLTVVFFVKSAVFAQVCYISCNTAHMGKHSTAPCKLWK